MNRPGPIFTNLGMHFIQVHAGQVALVQIEVNVRGLLAVNGRRLCKSKTGKATVSRGAVRMSLATPDDREIARSIIEADREAAETVDCLISELNRTRDALKRLQGQGC